MNDQSLGKTKQEAEERFVPINFDYVVSLPDGRQVRATTSYYPVPGASENAVLDRMRIALERQRSILNIEAWEADIRGHEEAIAKGEDDIARLNAENEKAIEALKAEHGEQAVKATGALRELEAEHEKVRGKRGSQFDPNAPGIRAKTQAYTRRQAEIVDQISKLKDERDVGEKNFRSTMAMFQDGIQKLRKKIEEAQKLI